MGVALRHVIERKAPCRGVSTLSAETIFLGTFGRLDAQGGFAGGAAWKHATGKLVLHAVSARLVAIPQKVAHPPPAVRPWPRARAFRPAPRVPRRGGRSVVPRWCRTWPGARWP